MAAVHTSLKEVVEVVGGVPSESLFEDMLRRLFDDPEIDFCPRKLEGGPPLDAKSAARQATAEWIDNNNRGISVLGTAKDSYFFPSFSRVAGRGGAMLSLELPFHTDLISPFVDFIVDVMTMTDSPVGWVSHDEHGGSFAPTGFTARREAHRIRDTEVNGRGEYAGHRGLGLPITHNNLLDNSSQMSHASQHETTKPNQTHTVPINQHRVHQAIA